MSCIKVACKICGKYFKKCSLIKGVCQSCKSKGN